MYITFFRQYVEDKTDEASANLSPDSKLSVDFEKERGSQIQRNVNLWRAACLCLSIICLILLLIIVVFGVKFQTGSTVCSHGEKTTDSHADVERCSFEWCQNQFPPVQHQCQRCRECPKGWLKFDDSCFFLSTNRLSWNDSQRNCTSRGGSLTVINSLKVQSFLSKKGNLMYWIGLRHRTSWTWVDNSPLGESYFSDVPSDGECVKLDTEKPVDKNWVKVGCHKYAYFICQLHL